ncbi:DUF2267 domain-containing protein [Aliidiomarina sanyensis]|uniref:DUF2267 domain-containing protein n=1 Tax=Aliidiomarina sanyensis TaxID=1249555 RepID=A0A432WPJ2_9GAMM|nr:DUF2267 domain-containing protein [Aliidiomarina sanyensis]RUO35703.1 DUF2267 domain-containing protein [Aliidiomarina sanyensis]
MPVPRNYYHATEQFENFMLDARDVADLQTTNMAWNMVVGVLEAFRRRLKLEDAIIFANHLPTGIRALFVADWDPYEEKREFADEGSLLEEIKSVRNQHNFSPDDACLRKIGGEAFKSWQVDESAISRFSEARTLLIYYRGD